MSEKYNYCKEQLNRLNSSTECLQLKITCDTDETNWLNLNNESIAEIITFLQARLEVFIEPKQVESPKDDRATSTVEMTIRELLHYNTQLPVYLRIHNHNQEFAVDDIFTIIENSANNRIIIETWQDFKLSDTQKEKIANLNQSLIGYQSFDKDDYFAQIESILANA